MDPPQDFCPPLSMQYRPAYSTQQGHPFIPMASQQYRPIGDPSGQIQAHPMQYAQTMQQFPPRSSQPGVVPPLSQLGGQGMPLSSPYTPLSQMQAPGGGQPWSSSSSSFTPVQQPSISAATPLPMNVPSSPSLQSSSDWQEHTSGEGKRYYYNKKTRQSSWEKPAELMTPLERADASTVWKEFTTPEGRKYYYNKITKESKWTIPEDLKLAREQAEKIVSQGAQSGDETPSHVAVADTVDVSTTSPVSRIPVSSTTSTVTSPEPLIPVVSVEPTPVVVSPVVSNVIPSTFLNPDTTNAGGFDKASFRGVENSFDKASKPDSEEAKTGMTVAGKVNATPIEEKILDDEPFAYATKQEAKAAFKELLKSTNVESDWTWEQTMRVIVNDKRYGALKTLGERKQAFNEYLGQRKKLDAEERRMRQKKAREEFTKMLEESQELNSSIRWREAIIMFENEERFKALERPGEREDLFESYMVELQKKEKAKAQEDHKKNLLEFRQFLESCDFIKANSQWRKVQDRLEDDERSLRLERIDRLLVFQDYIRDLEKEEEEEKKLLKEQLRRTERKNRDKFRSLMEKHIADGSLSAKTHWRDYCMEVKDSPEYEAVASNTGGSTPKDLFDDVAEELEKQFHEDKTRVKDALKLGKITMVSTLAFEDFKLAIVEDLGSPTISDINLKLVCDDLMERVKEKDEKEVKKRQRLAEEFTKLLRSKEISVSSEWEDCKPLLEESQEYRSIADDSARKEIFEEYITYLQEKAIEKERKREEEKAKNEKEKEEKEKRKEKDKERKEKEREREREKVKDRSNKKDETESENLDVSDSYGVKEEKKGEKDRDKKHRKRRQSSYDDVSSDKDEKEDSSKKSRRHGSDHKKSRKHAYSPESDSESKHKRHKRDHKDSSRKNGGHEELEDGELGEDGEIRYMDMD